MRIRQRGAGSQAGVTLIEILIAVVLFGIIAAPATAWATLVMRQQSDTQSDLRRINSMGLLNAYLPRDVESAAVVNMGGSDCAGAPAGFTSKLQFVPAGLNRRVVYLEGAPTRTRPVGAKSLWRHECDESGHLTRSAEVVKGIQPGSTQIDCPTAAPAPDPCAVDANRQVRVTVTPLHSNGTPARLIQLLMSRRTSVSSIGSPSASNRHPLAQISVSPPSGYASTTYRLSGQGSTDYDGTIASYAWTFPAGANCTPSNGGAVQTCTFGGVGDQLVQLTVTDNDGATNAAARTVTVLNRFPTAVASVTPSTGIAGTTAFTLSAAGSVDPDGLPIASYRWDLGDDMGASRYLTGPNPTFTFPADAAPGLRQVTLVVTDAAGDNDTAVAVITLNGPGGGGGGGGGTQIGDVVVNPTLVTGSGLPRLPDPVGPGLPSQTMTFTSATPLPAGTTASWTLSKGTTVVASGDGPTFTATVGPSDGGSYELVRTLHSASGDVPSAPVQFRVNTAPIASFTATGTGDAPRTVSFDSSASSDPDAPNGTIVSYRWSFGFFGHWVSSTPNTSWTFTDPGTYTVVLAVVDSDGALTTSVRTITVTGTPAVPAPPTWSGLHLTWPAVPGIDDYSIRLTYPCTVQVVPVAPADPPSLDVQSPSAVCPNDPPSLYATVETNVNHVPSGQSDSVKWPG